MPGGFGRNDRIEYFILRNVRPVGPTVGRYAGREIRQRIIDEWGRSYSFAGIAAFRSNGQYDCDALEIGEFILPPGLIYRLDKMPATWWEMLFRTR